MSDVLSYRKKPVQIEAMRLTGTNRHAVAEWCGGEAPTAAPSGTVYAPGLVSITTLEGTMWACHGDYVIRGVKGEFYPCKPDIFEATYEGPLCSNCGTPEPLGAKHVKGGLGVCYDAAAPLQNDVQ